MSEENVKFVLDGYARFNAGDKEAGLWFFTPDAEYHVAREDPDSAVHRGIDTVRGQSPLGRGISRPHGRAARKQREAGTWSSSGFVFSGHGEAAGHRWRWSWRHVLTMRDGKVARTVEYFDGADALKAAGLSE